LENHLLPFIQSLRKEKRDKFLNQPVIEGYKDFDILFYQIRED